MTPRPKPGELYRFRVDEEGPIKLRVTFYDAGDQRVASICRLTWPGVKRYLARLARRGASKVEWTSSQSGWIEWR